MTRLFLFKLFLVTSLHCLSTAAFSQEKTTSNKFIYFELAGSGGLFSFNYESEFYHKNNFNLNWRAGFSIAPIDKNNGMGLVFPVMLHGVYGKGAHKLDFGAGQGITITTKGSFFLLMPVCLGYRYQPEEKNWFMRIAYTPLISYIYNFQLQQWGGFSIGFQLKSKK